MPTTHHTACVVQVRLHGVQDADWSEVGEVPTTTAAARTHAQEIARRDGIDVRIVTTTTTTETAIEDIQ